MRRQLYVSAALPALILAVGVCCLLSIVGNLAAAAEQNSGREVSLSSTSLPLAHTAVTSETDTLDIPEPEEVLEPRLRVPEPEQVPEPGLRQGANSRRRANGYGSGTIRSSVTR